jgi:predicted nucleic acid-binding Zn ribbon protein
MGKHGESIRLFGVMWHPRKDGYYQNKHRGLLHRYMWAQANGPIPSGMHIHHKNHNKQDNRLDNFELLPAGEHARKHEKDTDWHAKGGHATWAKIKPRSFVCERCGSGFESRSTAQRPRFCSAACRDYASRAREQRVCSVCGTQFECPTRLPTRTCSRRCTSVYAYTQRGKGVRPDS